MEAVGEGGVGVGKGGKREGEREGGEHGDGERDGNKVEDDEGEGERKYKARMMRRKLDAARRVLDGEVNGEAF